MYLVHNALATSLCKSHTFTCPGTQPQVFPKHLNTTMMKRLLKPKDFVRFLIGFLIVSTCGHIVRDERNEKPDLLPYRTIKDTRFKV